MRDTRITMLSGQVIDPWSAGPEDFSLEDCFTSLAREPRFGGQTKRNYPVSQHSVNCLYTFNNAIHHGYSLTRQDPDWLCPDYSDGTIRKQILAHDYTEYVLKDIPRPIKYAMKEYRALEDKLWRDCVAPALGIPREMHPMVKACDNAMCLLERNTLTGYSKDDPVHREMWASVDEGYSPSRIHPAYLWELSYAEARKQIVDAHAKLFGAS